MVIGLLSICWLPTKVLEDPIPWVCVFLKSHVCSNLDNKWNDATQRYVRIKVIANEVWSVEAMAYISWELQWTNPTKDHPVIGAAIIFSSCPFSFLFCLSLWNDYAFSLNETLFGV